MCNYAIQLHIRISEAEFIQANRRTAKLREKVPHAAAAEYDQNRGRIVRPQDRQNGKSKGKEMTKATAELTVAEQRTMILAMFFEDDDVGRFLALSEHAGIDLAAAQGDAKQLVNLIAGHYRLKKGQYDIDRAANDLRTFPPIAASVEELKAKRARGAKR